MPRSKRVLVAAAIAGCAWTVQAQEVSIGEYSEAQRQAIKAEMDKLRGVVAPAAAAASAPAPAPVVIVSKPKPAPLPVVRVAGVSIIRQKATAEVSVGGTPYMLEVGDAVPGTGQTVSFIGLDRVELTTPGSRKAKPEVTTIKLRAAR